MLYNESSELFTELSNSDTEIISGGKGRKNRVDHNDITGTGGNATNSGNIFGNNGGVSITGGDGVVIDQS